YIPIHTIDILPTKHLGCDQQSLNPPQFEQLSIFDLLKQIESPSF
ncbi:MAG: hypothetical protein RLZZ115_3437, partial [Cyanobacteriota bacterium]